MRRANQRGAGRIPTRSCVAKAGERFLHSGPAKGAVPPVGMTGFGWWMMRESPRQEKPKSGPPQGLKPLNSRCFSARLKPCPPGSLLRDGFYRGFTKDLPWASAPRQSKRARAMIVTTSKLASAH